MKKLKTCLLILFVFCLKPLLSQKYEILLGSGFDGEQVEIIVMNSPDSVLFKGSVFSDDRVGLGISKAIEFRTERKENVTFVILINGEQELVLKLNEMCYSCKRYILIEQFGSIYCLISKKPFKFY